MSRIFVIGLVACALLAAAQAQENGPPQRTVKQIMNELITPTTNTIWGAYQLQTDAQWREVQQAAENLLAAGELLSRGGAGEGEQAMAGLAEWQTFNGQMLAATRKVLAAIAARDEEAMAAAGNDELYPPCESCHQRFQNR